MIEQLKQHKLLLVLIAVLTFMKFILVPMYTWQNEELSRSLLLNKQLEKTESAISTQNDTQVKLEEINRLIESSNELFHVVEDINTFQLNVQKNIQNRAEQHRLTVLSVGWLQSLKVESLNSEQYNLNLLLKGRSSEFLSFVAELETLKPKIQINTFDLQLRGATESDMGTVEAKVQLIFYSETL